MVSFTQAEKADLANQVKSQPIRSIFSRFNWLFLAVVVLPTAVAGGYFGLLASDQYISESRFVVRNPQRASPSGLGSLLQGTMLSRSQDDTYSVHEYIRSRDAMRELEKSIDLRAAFGSKDIDFINRFPGIDGDNSFERFHSYYQSHVGIAYDSVSSISVLKVRAYTAADATKINDLLLQMGESLVNNLNTRSRQDLIEVAESEVRSAEAKAMASALALAGFRAGRGVFDPDRQSALQLQAVTRLQEELMAAQAQLAQLRAVSPQNPQVKPLADRVTRMREAVAAETAKVLGAGGASLAGKSPEYDRLLLEKTFSDRQLGSALAALDAARNEAQRKQLYLERLVQPNLPDVATEPRRLRSVITVLIVGLVAWGVLSLVVASIREHAD